MRLAPLAVAIAALAVTPPAVARGQTPAPKLDLPRIDAVFKEIDRRDGPGCALGIYRQGRILHAAGYGMADLERRVPITPRSVFDIGSTSKQFAAAAVVLLALDGKLSLADEVRKHVPELRQYDRPITIDHLLRHTSGLRDYTGLLQIAGRTIEEITTDDDALAIIAAQRNLNFPVGTQWSYSNSGFFLLSTIVKRVSGKTLEEFTRERIFGPLGMTATQFRDRASELIPDRALGYAPAEGGRWRIAMSNWEQTGDGALQISIEEMAKWDANFDRPTVGGAEMIRLLTEPGKLDTGEPIQYARGLFVDEYRGVKRVHHGGAWEGYRAGYMRFPAQGTSFALFCNDDAASPDRYLEQVADIVLGSALGPKGPAAATTGPGAKVTLSADALRRLAGGYLDEKGRAVTTVTASGDSLAIRLAGGRFPLVATGPLSFTAVGAPVSVTFQESEGAITGLEAQVGSVIRMSARRFQPVAPTAAELEGYRGSYHSPELDVTWEVVVADGKLAVRRTRGAPITLEPSVKDAFHGRGYLEFTRDAAGAITGFDFSASRMTAIRFDRR